ncbi:hypothetical protein PIB30_076523, partial [Stylosanthes scabra]|nr:hypothetical protein [Stylosanthes scabra]
MELEPEEEYIKKIKSQGGAVVTWKKKQQEQQCFGEREGERCVGFCYGWMEAEKKTT